jgi:hypothetical protein
MSYIMKPLPLLILTLSAAVFAVEESPRPTFNPDQARPSAEGPRAPAIDVQRGNRNNAPFAQLSPEEQLRLHEAMQKAQQDPVVKEAHEQAAKAQQAAMEAQKKAREITDDAARKADPSVAPILEKVRKAMEARQTRPPNAEPSTPRNTDGGNRANMNIGNAQRFDPMTQLTPDEQRRVREAMGKANAEPAVKEAREAAAAAQKKVMQLTEEFARKTDPEIGPLLEKLRKSMESGRARPSEESPRQRNNRGE